MNVSTILEGSIRHSGDQLRIAVRLVNASEGYNVWSETYNRRMGDVIAIQEDIAASIVRSLAPRMSGGEVPVKPHTTNPEAYHLYLTGRYFWNRRTKSAFEKAIDCWQRAIACDPDCALAYAGIADAYALLGYYGFRRPLEAYEPGRAAARKALAINASLAEAHASLGELTLHFQHDLEGSAHELKTAVDLHPAYPRAHHTWSHYWISAGNIEKSFEASRRALDLDPTSLPLIAHLCWHHYHASEFDRAIEAGQKAIDMDGSFVMARIYLGRAYAFNRMYKEAIDEFEKSSAEGSTDVTGYLGLTFALAGERRKAEGVLAELISGSDEHYVSPYHFGTICLALGDVDGALQWLEKTVEERGRYAAALRLDPAVETIGSDPRFQTLLGRLAKRSAG